MENKYYTLLSVEGIFYGLNSRAVEHLLIFGDWIDLKKLKIPIPDSFYNLLFTCDTDPGYFELAGCVIGNKVMPSYIYDYAGNLPLYGYRMANFDSATETMWFYEMLDKEKSTLYKDMSLLCLSSDFITKVYEWDKKEIELSEILMEYNEGYD